MTVFRFAIDERSFQLTGLPADQVAPAIKALIDLLREVTNAGHRVCFDPDMFTMPIWGGLSFYELFTAGTVGLSVEDQIAATTYFATIVRWDDVNGPAPAALDVSVSGGPMETSGTLAWAHTRASLKLSAAACISCAATRPLGLNDVQLIGGGLEKIWFVNDMAGVRNFFRDLLSVHAGAPADLELLASDAFPELAFVNGSFAGIKSMSRGLPQIAPDIVRHLGALSDYGQAVFQAAWIDAEASFGARGVSLSDENGKTKQNKVARKERAREIDGQEILFWWHTKIEPDRDRIHFNPDRVPGGGKILIGIFCRHLTN
ncbi:hypothetical protein K9B35_04985 [Sphingomonas sp. R647]|uniref:hypothetical protein n=1 Tax=Sphingomonas sp. R647 TaxID=2875233 RepID=UPI001CD3E261|nr:hypothetical protein [Sphingomonas sp. R647]MCA1197312.1 hypothetical protein [Sphingomonas sp. R647]